MSQQLIHWLKKPSPFHSYYFVVGTEPYLLSEIKKTFKQNIVKSMEDFNYDEISAAESSAEDLISFSETLPMLSQRRLLLCFQSELFSEKDWDKLCPLFSKEDQNTLLVFFFNKKDGRKKHFKALKDKVLELEASPLKNWQVDPWLNFLSSKEGVSFSVSAKSLFLQLVGSSLFEISIELKKLKQYLGTKTQAEEKDVLACNSRLKIESLFDLTEALGDRNIVKSLTLLAFLLEQGENAMTIVSLLARHIRLLMKVKQAQSEKLSSSELVKKTGLPPYFLKNYIKQEALWTKSQLENTLESLFLTDKALKSVPKKSFY